MTEIGLMNLRVRPVDVNAVAVAYKKAADRIVLFHVEASAHAHHNTFARLYKFNWLARSIKQFDAQYLSRPVAMTISVAQRTEAFIKRGKLFRLVSFCCNETLRFI